MDMGLDLSMRDFVEVCSSPTTVMVFLEQRQTERKMLGSRGSCAGDVSVSKALENISLIRHLTYLMLFFEQSYRNWHSNGRRTQDTYLLYKNGKNFKLML